VGKMSKNERGVPWVSSINLKPQVTYTGSKQPTPIEVAQLHHQAHEQCYIANSIKTEVKVVPG
jgi:organic hydroperoxide reductase OsmC/OhrA